MNGRADVGQQVIDYVFRKMMIDEKWSTTRTRGFTRWGYRFAQRIWAEPARPDHGFSVSKVMAITDVMKHVPPTEGTFVWLAMLNTHSMMGRYIYDPEQKRVSLCCCAYFHGENVDWQSAYFVQAVAIQAAQAHAEANYLAKLLEGELDETESPRGRRREIDDILNILTVLKATGAKPSPFVGTECSDIQNISPPPFLMATSDAKGATVEFPFPGAVPSSTMLRILPEVEHPKLGSGALFLLRIPHAPGVHQDCRLVNDLNRAELHGWNATRCFGAWSLDLESTQPEEGIAYVMFLPAMAARTGLTQNEVQQMAARSAWLHRYCNLPSSIDDTGIRLRVAAVLASLRTEDRQEEEM